MDIELAECLAKHEIKKWIPEWKLRWIKSKNVFGRCCHNDKTIELSRPLCFYNDQSEVRDTVLHEIAHALAGQGHGHDRVWKQWCRKVGCRPIRCYSIESVVVPTKYALYCGCCKKVIQRTNRLRPANELATMYHKKCGPQAKGMLRLYNNSISR